MQRLDMLLAVTLVSGGCATAPAASAPTASPEAASKTAPGPTPSTPPAPSAEMASEASDPPSASKETLLILPLNSGAQLREAGTALDEMILTAVHDLSRYRVLGSSDLNALLGVERMKDAVGCSDVECAAELGGALGAELLVAGTLSSLGDQAVLSLRLMNTRIPSVLSRASTRGAPSADGLVRMMEVAVADLFGVEDAKSASVVSETTPAQPYAEYTDMVTRLGKLSASLNYTAVLEAVEGYEGMAVTAPPGTDLPELLAYYRLTACFMLKRIECVRGGHAQFVERWPDGMYRTAVDSYRDQLDDEQLAREDGAEELRARMAEIRELRQKGSLSDRDAATQMAYAYLGAKRYDEAAQHFRRLLKTLRDSPDQAIAVVEGLTLALTQVGRFEEARKLLEMARKRYPRRFRRAGLHHRLRQLPR